MKPERGLAELKQDWLSTGLLEQNGLAVAHVHESLGGGVTVIVPSSVVANVEPTSSYGEKWISTHASGKTAYADDFPVGYRFGSFSNGAEVRINSSISKFSREQRALAITYAVAAASCYKNGELKFKFNLDTGKRVTSEVMTFVAQLTGGEQSMAIDLLRVALRTSK